MAALRDLSTPSMIFVLKEMLERPACKDVLEHYPSLQGYKHDLVETYEQLVASRPAASEPDSKGTNLQQRLTELDHRHDIINNVGYRLLGLAGQILPNPEHRELFERLQKQLYPHRLRVNLFKRSDEAAEALRLKKQLDNAPEARKALDALSLAYGKEKLCAGALLDELFEVAEEMNLCLRQAADLPSESKAHTETEPRKLFVAWMSRFQETAALALRNKPHLLTQLLEPLDEKLKEVEAAEAAQPAPNPTPPTPNTNN